MSNVLALQTLETVPKESAFCISSGWSDWSIHTA